MAGSCGRGNGVQAPKKAGILCIASQERLRSMELVR
jgi:hypothetical protein